MNSDNGIHFDIITIFPNLIKSYTEQGIVGRAFQEKKVSFDVINPRDFTKDIHHTVDDKPYGGGAGMVMKYDCLAESFNHIEKNNGKGYKVYFSPKGKPLSHNLLIDLIAKKHLILLCGRYEGVDERIIEDYIDMECSIGDYVLSGGEIASCVLIDALVRLIPNVIKKESIENDSFSTGLLDNNHYTRPAVIASKEVPDILQGGNHEAICRYRKKEALGETWYKKPELFSRYSMTEEELNLLNEYLNENRFLK